jgi:uncharacterized repeat protein (TIGR03803 family)
MKCGRAVAAARLAAIGLMAIALAATVGSPAARAQANSFSVLYTFNFGVDGGATPGPFAGPILDPGGDLYGTTSGGGANDAGMVFKVTPDGVLSEIYSFLGGTDGASPYAGVIEDRDGNLYGTTFDGGSNAACPEGCGTVYEIDPQGDETILYSFQGTGDGAGPVGGLVRDGQGNLYGTTWYTNNQSSANSGCGTVFMVTPAGAESVLHSFSSCGADGAEPNAGVILGTDGNLYGTTTTGGAYNKGTIYEVTTAGAETVLYSFTGKADGGDPVSTLVRDTAGNLYGTTYSGGAGAKTVCGRPLYGCGVVFKLDRAGAETVLYTFRPTPEGELPHGAHPAAGLLFDEEGNFFGTTQAGGGANGGGVIFKLDLEGTQTVLHVFGAGAEGDYPGGAGPWGLVGDATGTLYGTTLAGGRDYYECGNGGEGGGCGTVFMYTP